VLLAAAGATWRKASSAVAEYLLVSAALLGGPPGSS